MSVKPDVLITGASTGIGAVYADRFAHRGHNLVLVARDKSRMEQLADKTFFACAVVLAVLSAGAATAAPAAYDDPLDVETLSASERGSARSWSWQTGTI